MRVFDRASKTPPASVPDPSAAEVAAGVAFGSKHQLIELELRRSRNEREELRQQIVRLIAAKPNDSEGGSRANRKIAAKGREREALDKRIRELLAEVIPLRQARSQRVAEALAQRQRQAAAQLLKGASEAGAAGDELRAIAEAIAGAGGGASLGWGLPVHLAQLEAQAREIVERNSSE